jgi:hypothetical protein
MKIKQLTYKRDKDGNVFVEVTVINIPSDWHYGQAIRNATDCLLVGGKATDEMILQFSWNEFDWSDAIVTVTGTRLENGHSLDVKAKVYQPTVQQLLAFMNGTPVAFREKQIELPLEAAAREAMATTLAEPLTQEQLLDGEDLPDYGEARETP